MTRLLTSIAILASCCVSFAQDEKPKAKDLKQTTIDVGGDTFSLDYPKSWSFEKIQPDPSLPAVVILTTPDKKQKLNINLLIPPASAPEKSQESVDQAIKAKGQRYQQGSVEKKTVIKPLGSKDGPGSYASFTDASLADVDETKPGQYRVITTIVLMTGKSIVAADLMADEIDSEDHKAAIEVLKSGLKLTKSEAPQSVKWDEKFAITVPGEKMTINFVGPKLIQFTGQAAGPGFRFSANGVDNFNISAFVEKGKPGSTHTDCYEHYWEKSKNVPYLDKDSVEVDEAKDFMTVAYNYTVQGQTMPHRNYYFAVGDRWVDVHVSVFPSNKDSLEKLAEFGKQLRYTVEESK